MSTLRKFTKKKIHDITKQLESAYSFRLPGTQGDERVKALVSIEYLKGCLHSYENVLDHLNKGESNET